MCLHCVAMRNRDLLVDRWTKYVGGGVWGDENATFTNYLIRLCDYAEE